MSENASSLTAALADIRLAAECLRAYGYGRQVEQAAMKVLATDPPEQGKPRGVSPLVAEYRTEFATNGKSKRLATIYQLTDAITNAIEVSRGNREGHDPKAQANILEALAGTLEVKPAADSTNQCYTKADLRSMTKLGQTAITKYTKNARVEVPNRGTKNHRYTIEETRKILQAVIDGTQDSKVKQRCKEALSELA